MSTKGHVERSVVDKGLRNGTGGVGTPDDYRHASVRYQRTDAELGRVAYETFHGLTGLSSRLGMTAERRRDEALPWDDLEVDSTGRCPVREKWIAIAAAVAMEARK